MYKTERGYVRGEIVSSRPGGPHVIETGEGKIEVKKIDGIR